MSWYEDMFDVDMDRYDVWEERMQLIKQHKWLDKFNDVHDFDQMDDQYILNCMSWALNEIHYAQSDYDYYTDYSGDELYENEKIEDYIDDLNYVYDVFYKYYNERINNKMISWE